MSPVEKRLISEVLKQKPVSDLIVNSLYSFAETGLNEVKSSELLCYILSSNGFNLKKGIADMPTAFCASTGSGNPHIAFLAEMDALPSLGHGCGHNIIAASSVIAAMALKSAGFDIGTISVFGTPAEELGIGKIALIEAGFFKGVDFAMMIHPSSKRQVIKEFMGLCRFSFTFYGRSAHAAAHPEDGINALDAVIQMFNSINALRQQLQPDVKVHGIITNGGSAPNIIPDRAAALFYVRGMTTESLEDSVKRVKECAEGASIAAGCRLEIEQIGKTIKPMNINRSFADVYSQQLVLLGLPEAQRPENLNRGSSDIGNLSWEIPVIHPHVPLVENRQIHTLEFAEATISDIGLEAALEGGKALALTALKLLTDAKVRDKIIKEFQDNFIVH